MCGIVGAVTKRPAMVNLARSLGAIEHRGPDDAGIMYWSPGCTPLHDPAEPSPCRVALGHRRLAIIDLSSAGRQPMRSADGSRWIVFNGEIYNYVELRRTLETEGLRFRTSTDTEVALEAIASWGPDVALRRFVGMFALAVLDTRDNSVLLARDPFGIKPLYVCDWQHGIAFGSELSALVTLPGIDRSPDASGAWLYLRHGVADNGSTTMLSGVKQVEPATWMRLGLAEESISQSRKRYWDPARIQERRISFDDAAAEIRDRFLRNVSLHLRSDVPLGSALSGGIDSSAIVCAIRHLEPDREIHTFSYLADDPRLDESRWVAIVNKHVGALAHPVTASADDLIRDVHRLIEAQGEPFSTTSIYAQHCVFREAREAGVKVMLDGQGADELMGGYIRYQGARLASLLAGGNWLGAMRFLSGGRERRLQRSQLVRGAVRSMLPWSTLPVVERLTGRNAPPPWLKEEWFRERGARSAPPRVAVRKRRYLHADLVEGVTVGLLSLLHYEDRNSMAYSIESRVPFLTTDFAEALLSLPEHYLVAQDGTTKHVFRRAMRGIVPDAILDRRDKIGFATPEGAWLKGSGDLVERALDQISSIPFFDARVARASCASDGLSSPHTWRLLNYTIWYHAMVRG
ncbi:MAG: asparagine synthase (glutamine-hydrolyzing) [Deltaproteobacteria bacterium]|nr:asparagine synthase (glutamine-hydrolyzing) [Deltaproteobacteria bacterium]